MSITALDSLNVKTIVKQTHSKKTIADKWIVSGYIQAKGKAENIGQMRVGICEVGKNPAFNSVDAQIALSIVRDVLGALNLTDEQNALVGNIPIVQALHARQTMLTDPAAIAEAQERAKGKLPSKNPLVATVNSALAKLDEMIAAEDNGNTGEQVASALVQTGPLASRTRKPQ